MSETKGLEPVMVELYKKALRQRTLDMLNELLKADPQAIYKLIESRVEVNDALMQTSNDVVICIDNNKNCLGLLGLINGILGPEHKIVARYEDDGTLFEFRAYQDANQEAT